MVAWVCLWKILTDNKNRVSSDMRIATNKRGGHVATPGSVSFNFDRKGILQIPKKNAIEEELFLTATEAGAEDFEAADDAYMITMNPSDLFAVKDALSAKGIECESATLKMIPKSYVECDLETAKANIALIEWLKDLEDVDAVYHNMKIPDELI